MTAADPTPHTDPTAAAVRAAQAEALREYADLAAERERSMEAPRFKSAADGRERNVWGLVKYELRDRADRPATDTAAPEGEGRPCDNNEACPNCTTAYVECGDGNCTACDDAYAAPVAVEGVETVETLAEGLAAHMSRGTSGRWIVEYGETPETLAARIVQARAGEGALREAHEFRWHPVGAREAVAGTSNRGSASCSCGEWDAGPLLDNRAGRTDAEARHATHALTDLRSALDSEATT